MALFAASPARSAPRKACFFWTLESELTGTGPTQCVSLNIRQSHYRIIERGLDMRLALFNILLDFFLSSFNYFFLCQFDSS
jgi:hypothetical protein